MKQQEEIRQVSCAQGALTYTLIRKSVKNINLRVKPAGVVVVSANRRVPVSYIDAFVQSKQVLIRQALERFAALEKERKPENRERYATAESRRQQKALFDELCREIYPLFEPYGIAFPQVKIRYMTSRWGSCQPARGVITLNSRLIDAPRRCAEYVVLHEFAHFIHPNHSKQFYALVESMMPDWREWRQALTQVK